MESTLLCERWLNPSFWLRHHQKNPCSYRVSLPNRPRHTLYTENLCSPDLLAQEASFDSLRHRKTTDTQPNGASDQTSNHPVHVCKIQQTNLLKQNSFERQTSSEKQPRSSPCYLGLRRHACQQSRHQASDSSF